MQEIVNKWSWDIETIPHEQALKEGSQRTWLCGIKSWDKTETFIEQDINILFEKFIKTLKGKNIIYSHNGGNFDNHFIMDYLTTNFTFTTNSKSKMKVKQFTMIMRENKQIMHLYIKVSGKTSLEFRDTAMLIPAKLEQMGKMVGSPKQHIDYSKHHNEKSIKDIDHKEIDYLHQDLNIIIDFFNKLENEDETFNLLDTKLTISWETFNRFEKSFEKGNVISKEIYRENYTSRPLAWTFKQKQRLNLKLNHFAGGLTQVRKGIAGVLFHGECMYYDVNGLYGSVMNSKSFPYGAPLEPTIHRLNSLDKYLVFYKFTTNIPLYVNNIIPFIPNRDVLKKCKYLEKLEVGKTYYIMDNLVPFVKKHYLPKNKKSKNYLSFEVNQMYFKREGIFNKVLQDYTDKKAWAKKNGKTVMEKYYKLLINALFGKFGQHWVLFSYIYNKDNELEKIENVSNTKKYIPIACAITSYAREILLTGIANNWDRFLYCDTDCIQLKGNQPPKGLHIDRYKSGAWKREFEQEDEEGNWNGKYDEVEKYVYICPKRYAVKFKNGTTKITVAGINDYTFRNTTSIEIFTYLNKKEIRIINPILQKKIMKGGISLIESNKILKIQ